MKPNPLGDIRAESDIRMLSAAFYRTPDYLTLIEPTGQSKSLIIGRRGTGKSALFHTLKQYFQANPGSIIITIAPDDTDIISFRAICNRFQSRFNLIKSGFKLVWRYAIVLEIFTQIADHYKITSDTDTNELSIHAKRWQKSGKSFLDRFIASIRSIIPTDVLDDSIIADMASQIPIRELESRLSDCLNITRKEVVVLADRLDEGYEPDSPGIGPIAGLCHAIVGHAAMLPRFHGYVLLRDNIFRSISTQDTDFSRNLEGQVLRLHWDRYHLLNMIALRLKSAYNIGAESSQRVWDLCTEQGIRGTSGFDHCLRMTLFRPRDLLLLLNEAFYHAETHERNRIDNSDIDHVAKGISTNRLNDLIKEYDQVVGGLGVLLHTLHGTRAKWTLNEMVAHITSISTSGNNCTALAQEIALIGAGGVIAQLFSIGFLGALDSATESFVFCHDGKNPIHTPEPDSIFLVHPCYWISLGLGAPELTEEIAAEIHDEYDVEVSSETPEIRKRRIGQIMSELTTIPEGASGAAVFEEWCKQVIGVIFADSLRNLELHPNKNAVQRRDLVATNLCLNSLWKRIYDDYRSRQVIFEIKNVSREISGDEFRQALSYTNGDYGKLIFIISRHDHIDPKRDGELQWIREIQHQHNVLIVKLTAAWLNNLLSKLRSPQKHDAPSDLLNGLLDRYTRLYLSHRAG